MSVSGTAASTVAGRIGPNAIIRMVEALDAFEGRPVAKRIFAASGNAHYLAELPSEMVPEVDVTAFHREVHTALGDSRARSVAWIAGRRTLLTHRIPALPPAAASRMLLLAIAKNARTFTATGRFSALGPTCHRDD